MIYTQLLKQYTQLVFHMHEGGEILDLFSDSRTIFERDLLQLEYRKG